MNTAGQRTALLTAYEKTGLAGFAKSLVELGWTLLASAGTTKHLLNEGISARDVAEIVGPPILGHRVVTLSREVHATLLAQYLDADRVELERLNLPYVDLAYVDTYPLQAEIADPNHTTESVIEKTDIGGPTILRAAAKGQRIVVCNRGHFGLAFKLAKALSLRSGDEIESEVEQEARYALASVAELSVSDYCRASAKFYRGLVNGPLEKILAGAFL